LKDLGRLPWPERVFQEMGHSPMGLPIIYAKENLMEDRERERVKEIKGRMDRGMQVTGDIEGARQIRDDVAFLLDLVENLEGQRAELEDFLLDLVEKLEGQRAELEDLLQGDPIPFVEHGEEPKE